MVYTKFTIIQAITIISFFILSTIKANTYEYEDLCSNSHEECRLDNTTLECSGRGKCICNKCECEMRPNYEEIIYGKYCQCDNFSCERRNNLLCSANGICECGQCLCRDGWTGKDCGCRESSNHNHTCISPADRDIVCSGHGQCICGKCLCDMETEFYSGKFCERCLSCASRCSDLKNCVECKVIGSDENKNKNKCEEKCGKEFLIVEISNILEYNEEKEEDHCVFYDENDCKYHFVYYETAAYEKDELQRTTHVRVQKEKICPKKPSTEIQNRTLI